MDLKGVIVSKLIKHNGHFNQTFSTSFQIVNVGWVSGQTYRDGEVELYFCPWEVVMNKIPFSGLI